MGTSIARTDYEHLRFLFDQAAVAAVERRRTEVVAVRILGEAAAVAIADELRSDQPDLDALLDRLGISTDPA